MCRGKDNAKSSKGVPKIGKHQYSRQYGNCNVCYCLMSFLAFDFVLCQNRSRRKRYWRHPTFSSSKIIIPTWQHWITSELDRDIFLLTYDGKMAKVVEGHRRYGSARNYINL